MENKNLNNDPEKKVSEDKKPKDEIAAELDDEMLNNVAGGESESKSEDESTNDSGNHRRRIMKPIIL